MKKIKPIMLYTIILIFVMIFTASCDRSNPGNTNTSSTCTHSWSNATCTTPKTCSLCGKTEGSPLNHSWTDATCTAPKTCSLCEETEGLPIEHSWSNATCTTPKTCSLCGKTEGSPLNHSWTDATCTTPRTCSICKKTEGNIGTHTDSGNGTCTYCGKDILLLDMQKGFDVTLIIPSVGTMNSYCSFKFTNQTKYDISYEQSWVGVNGQLLYSQNPTFTLSPGHYITKTFYVDIFESTASQHKKLYLDNDSLAYTTIKVSGKIVFIRFGVNGPVAFGYSLESIGIY